MTIELDVNADGAIDISRGGTGNTEGLAQGVESDKVSGEPGVIGAYEAITTGTNIWGFKGPDDLGGYNVLLKPPNGVPTSGQVLQAGTPVFRTANGNVPAHYEIPMSWADLEVVAITEVATASDPATLTAGQAEIARDTGDMTYKGVSGSFVIPGTYTTTIPTMTSCTVSANGTTVTVVFDETMTTGAGGATGWTLNDPTKAMTYVSGTGTNTIVFSVATAVLSGQTPTVTYTQPGNGWEATPGGGDLATLTTQPVTNNSTQTAPTLVSTTIAANGTDVTLVFSESVSVGAGGNDGWTLNNPTRVMTYSSGSGSDTLVYTVATAIQDPDVPTISYTQPGNGIEATSGGRDLDSIVNNAVTNNSTVLGVVSITVGTDGTTVTVVMSANTSVGAGGSGGMTLNTPTSALTYLSGAGTTSLVFTSASTIQDTDTPTATYVQPGDGLEATSGGADLASFTAKAVTNNSTQGFACSASPDFTYSTLDSWTAIGYDHYVNAFFGAQWQGSNRTVCAVDFYLDEIGNVDALNYSARVYSLSGGNLGSLIGTSGTVAGSSIVAGWNKFSFSSGVTLNTDYVIIVGRTDPTNESTSNYIRGNYTFNSNADLNTVLFDSSGNVQSNLDRAIAIRLYSPV